jgi:hypothetical protein
LVHNVRAKSPSGKAAAEAAGAALPPGAALVAGSLAAGACVPPPLEQAAATMARAATSDASRNPFFIV